MPDSVAPEEVLAILVENFPNGIRLDSLNEIKIRRLLDKKIPADFDVFNLIASNALEYNGKFYIFLERDRQQLSQLIHNTFRAGFSPIFYAKFFDEHRDFLTTMNIFSAEILKKLLRTLNENFFCDEDFFAAHENRSVKDAVENVLLNGDASPEDIIKNLRYIPPANIRDALADRNKFLPTRDGRYTSIKRLNFDLTEIATARSALASKINRNGYTLLDLANLTNNIELNPSIAEQNLRTAIFSKFWSNDFSKHGNILSFRSKPLSAAALLNDFCENQKSIPADELFDYAARLFPNDFVSTALRIARKSLVRVSKNLFVRKKAVHFHSEDIDDALDSFVRDKIISLRSVTSFATFPPVENFVWNAYLLESFLRNFSWRYKFIAPSENNSCLGAIYPQWMHFKNYLEIQAKVLVQEKIPLSPKPAERFLRNFGFRARLSKNATEQILRLAQKFSNRSTGFQ